MTSLSFTKDASGRYVASFDGTGNPMAVQLLREGAGDLIVYGNIGSMPKVVLQGLSRFYAGKDWFCTINVPVGVKITIESEIRVIQGGYE